jgi:hypothetical protein
MRLDRLLRLGRTHGERHPRQEGKCTESDEMRLFHAQFPLPERSCGREAQSSQRLQGQAAAKRADLTMNAMLALAQTVA